MGNILTANEGPDWVPNIPVNPPAINDLNNPQEYTQSRRIWDVLINFTIPAVCMAALGKYIVVVRCSLD